MTTPAAQRRLQNIRHGATVAGGLILIGVIVWVDVATGLWQDVVILSGLAAGLVMFILTTVVLNRLTERGVAKRWAPMNRLAITEFLHAIVDDDASEVARGHFVARTLKLPAQLGPESLKGLRHQVVNERRALSDALSRWTQFLTSSGDNEEILLHVANVSLYFDAVRDATLAIEHHSDSGTTASRTELATALEATVAACNEHSSALVAELQSRVHPRTTAHLRGAGTQRTTEPLSATE
ncbi:hypothetical protein ACXR2W_00305 [Leucobacter sp. HY1908]